jgi:hypothetical protein
MRGLLCSEPGFGYGWRMAFIDALRRRARILRAGIVGLAAGLFVPTVNAEAQQSASTITCTNPASGTSWQITIDYRNATVDANPAAITATAISWFDPKDGGNYTLDRKSGALTASVASSTGGYFRHGRCTLETSR